MITLKDCVMTAWDTPDFRKEFDRLNGTHLAGRQPAEHSAILREVDKASGKTDADMLRFIAFVDDCVFQRLPTPPTREAL